MAGASNPQDVQRPNVYNQAAGAYTGALGATAAAANFRPQMVGTQFGYNPNQVNAERVGTQFGYNPNQVNAERVGTQFGYNPNQVNADLASGGIQTYLNPFVQQVVDTSMADLERQRQIQMAQMGAQATASRAFGGSRQGVAQSLTNDAFARQAGQIASGLRMQGFNTALGASQQDVANRMQAALANQATQARAAEFGQSTGLQAQGMNQQAAMQAALASQAAQARAAEFGQSTGLQAQGMNQQAAMQGAQIGLNAAGQLGNLAGQGFGFGQQIGQQQMQQGTMQQGINQALIDAARGQYAGFTGAPQQALTLPLAALGAANMGQNTQATSQRPGLFNYLSLLAAL